MPGPRSSSRRVQGRPLRARIAAAIEALPGLDRLVLALRLLDRLSALETAGALRLPAREVEERTRLALATLAGQAAPARASVRRRAA